MVWGNGVLVHQGRLISPPRDFLYRLPGHETRAGGGLCDEGVHVTGRVRKRQLRCERRVSFEFAAVDMGGPRIRNIRGATSRSHNLLNSRPVLEVDSAVQRQAAIEEARLFTRLI